MNIDGASASFYTGAHPDKLHDWSMILLMVLHSVVVSEVYVLSLRVLGGEERTIIEGLILPNLQVSLLLFKGATFPLA